jgi:LEA14-like dessication related protein
MKRLRAALAMVTATTAIGLVGGCATLVPKLEPPVLTVTRVDLGGGSLDQQQLHLTVHVVNPNAREIRIRGIDCKLELSGQPFASGATDAAFTLPASGETDFGLNVTANLNAALGALLGGLGHKTVDYHFYGVVHLGQGLVRNIPFDQRSHLRL